MTEQAVQYVHDSTQNTRTGIQVRMKFIFHCLRSFKKETIEVLRWNKGCVLGLEPLCCKKQQKSSWPVTSLWNRGPLKILNGMKLILDDQGNHLDPCTLSLESFRSFRGPLFRKPVTGQELFCCFLQQTGSNALTNFRQLQWHLYWFFNQIMMLWQACALKKAFST